MPEAVDGLCVNCNASSLVAKEVFGLMKMFPSLISDALKYSKKKTRNSHYNTIDLSPPTTIIIS